jgi:hypothetical protein
MACSDEDHGRSRRPSAEDREWSHRSGTRWPSDREDRWCCVRSAPCLWRWVAWVSWLSLRTKGDSLWVDWHQNHSDGLLRFSLKTGAWVFRFGPQNWHLRFGDLCLKITLMVSWFGPQNYVVFGLLVAQQNRWREDNAGHASRSGGLLCPEASRARVS